MKIKVWMIVVLIAFVLAAPVQVQGTAQDSGTSAERALRHVSQTFGIPIERLTVSNEGTVSYPLSGRQLWRGKVWDAAGKKVYSVGIDSGGNFVDPEEARQAEAAAYKQRFGKLHPALYDLLQAKGPEDTVEVGIWLKSSANEAAGTVAAKYPQARLAGHVPGRDTDLNLYREIYEEMMAAARQAYLAAEAPLAQLIQSRGFEVIQDSQAAPLVLARISKSFILELNQRPEIDTIYHLDKVYDQLDVSGPAVGAPVTREWGFTGAGVRVAVIEARMGIDFGHPSIPDQDLPLGNHWYHEEENWGNGHATWVAGVIASTDAGYRGIAPGGLPLLSGNSQTFYFANVKAATEWAINEGDYYGHPGQRIGATVADQVRVINGSFGEQNSGAMTLWDRYYDHIVFGHRRTVVVAAGQRSTSPDMRILSPGLGYNVITVGAYDDGNSVGWDDDVMWNDSAYIDPDNTDREKPEVVAPGVNIMTTTLGNGWTPAPGVNGTSVAAPHVAGAAAVVMSRDQSGFLKYQPEAVKAIIMASAINNIEGESRLSDKDGAGGVYLGLADDIVSKGQWDWDQVTINDFDQSGFLNWYYYLDAVKGQQVRAVISWASHPADNAQYSPDPLESDLDLLIYGPGGLQVASSISYDNNYEIVDFVAPQTGQYRIVVSKFRFDGAYEYLGVAWASLFHGTWGNNSNTFPAGWNLFSFPLDPIPASWSMQLGDDIPTSLYVYRYDPQSGGYQMYPGSSSPFQPRRGEGYWNKRPSETLIDIEGFQPANEDFRIHVLPGWNLIGDPFNFNVDWGNAQVYNPATGQTVSIELAHLNNWISKFLYKYDPTIGSYQMFAAPDGQLDPWTGYWAKAYVDADLIIPPIQMGFGAGAGMGDPLVGLDSIQWSAQLGAAIGSVSDAENYASVATDAGEQYDTNDAAEPPMGPSPAIRLYFPHDDWPLNPGDYTQDARPEAGAITWDFEVQATSRALITLTWDVSQIPTSYTTVQLLDGAGNVLVSDMRSTSQYQYTPPYGWAITPFKFKVS